MKNNKYLVLVIFIIFLVVLSLAFINRRAINFQSPTAPVQNSSSATTISSSTISAAPYISEEYDVSLPDAIMLVDSQGRRTGKDPATGTYYHEIPDTNYQEIGNSGQLVDSNMVSGEYNIYVLGAKTGSYWFDGYNSSQKLKIFRGTIQEGSMIDYLQIINASNLASSTLSLKGTSSSTVSITSAPPHNLPPPTLQ